MNTPRRILLLTTAHSYRNEPFLRAAKRLGVEVIQAVDMHRTLAEHWHFRLGIDFGEPTTAVDAIVAYAREHPITAIIPVDDSGVVVAAQAAQRLDLPHNAPAAAEAARDKFRMRTLLQAAGVPCPWFRRFSLGDDFQVLAGTVPYPCVVKPVDLNGSRGVIRADTPTAFVAAASRLQRMLGDAGRANAPFLVESFIPGTEVALEGILDCGKLTVLALFDKPDPLDGPYFEETIYVTPSRLPDTVQHAIADSAARAAQALGLQIGPVHAELRVNAAGPWILEVNGRSIGGLCGQILRFDLDISLEELILRQACGLPWQPQRAATRATGVMMIPIPEAGILRNVVGLEAAQALSGVDGIEITAAVNYPLKPLPEGDNYLGFIFASGESPEAVENTLRAAHAQLRIEIIPEIGLSG